MKKDIEWAKKEIESLMTEESQNYPHDEMVEQEIVLSILNQLEVETLSSEWIEERSYNIEEYWQVADMMDGAQYAVSVENLQNLLMPKLDLPVIPDYVAEYIKNEKESEITLEETLENMGDPDFQEIDIIKKTSEYVKNNIIDFIDAYRDGYTVEEKKYSVTNGVGVNLLYKSLGEVTEYQRHERPQPVDSYKLTEQEIKDFDERYFAFAEPVEELEE